MHSGIRVLMVGSWEYSGSGKAMSYFAEALGTLGYQVSILSFSSPHDYSLNPTGYSSTSVRTVRKFRLPFDNSPDVASAMALLNDIVEWFDSNKAERVVIWGHYLYPYALACMLAASVVAWDCEKHTCLVTPAGSDVWDGQQHLCSILRHVFERRPDIIGLVYSSMFREAARKTYPFIRRCETFAPVLPDSHFHLAAHGTRSCVRKSLSIREHEPTIGVICNMRPAKNIDTLHDTLVRFGIDQLSPTILLVGPDRGQTIRGFRTIRTGTAADVRPYIWACDCTVNVSAYDSFNLALLESVLCGVPAFTNAHAGIATNMRQWMLPTVWDDSNAASVIRTSSLLHEVLTSGERRSRIGEKLRDEAVQEFGLSRNLQRVANEFEALLTKDAKHDHRDLPIL